MVVCHAPHGLDEPLGTDLPEPFDGVGVGPGLRVNKVNGVIHPVVGILHPREDAVVLQYILVAASLADVGSEHVGYDRGSVDKTSQLSDSKTNTPDALRFWLDELLDHWQQRWFRSLVVHNSTKPTATGPVDATE